MDVNNNKIRIVLKDPDGVYDSIRRFAKDKCPDSNEYYDTSELIEEAEEKIKDKLKRWIEFSEYVIVEFDLDEMTAKVIPVDEDCIS